MSDRTVRVLDNIKEIRAINDPYRQEILFTMGIIDRPATSKEIATKMNEPPSKVNYHLKVLEQYNFVELDHTENINGIIAKYYKRADINLDLKLKTGESAREREIAHMIETVFNRARDKYLDRFMDVSSEDGEYKNEEKGMLSSTMLYLSKEDVEEVTKLFRKLSENKKDGKVLYNFFLSFIKSED